MGAFLLCYVLLSSNDFKGIFWLGHRRSFFDSGSSGIGMGVVQVGSDSKIRNEFSVLIGEVVFGTEEFKWNILEKFGTVIEIVIVDGEAFLVGRHLKLHSRFDRGILP